MSFTTSFDSQVIGQLGFRTVPLVTIGDIIPDTTGALNSSTAGDYQPVGILDGMGAIRFDEDTVRAFVNHELVDNAGVPYQLIGEDGTPYTITGGRISYFDINIETFEIEDAGIAYNRIFDANGNIASDNSIFGQVLANPFDPTSTELRPIEGFSRFCSGGLNEAEQFGPGQGLADDIYFAGEEVGGFFNGVGGANWALDVATGDIYQLPALGRGSWENTSEIDTGTTTHVAFILADDQSPFDFDGDGEVEGAPFYLYVGEKNPDSDNFLERNGLAGGNLYVWVPDANLDDNPDNDIVNALQFRGAGTTATGAWVQIDNTGNGTPSFDGSTGFDQFGYPTQGNLITQAEAAGAFVISRPEDVATNPNNPSEIVQAVTGVDTFAVDETTGNGADTFGALYTLDTDFTNLTGEGLLTATATVLYDGDQDPNRSLRSPDNLDWADDGFIYVQEDEAEEDSLTGEVLFGQGAANPNEASIVRIDPNASVEDAAVGANVQTIAIVDRSQILDPTVADPTTAVDEDFERTEDGIFGGGEVLVTDPSGNEVILDAGEWETSGIIDVSNLFDEGPGSVFLFNVQAHGLADQDEENLEQGDQSALIDDILAEGGQLLLLLSPLESELSEVGPAQVTGLDGYEVEPIFTIGQTFEGATGALNSTTAGEYTPPGILDGIGAFELNDDTVRVLTNHELNEEDGYAYSLENGLQLTGARVSYFDIDKETLEVVDTGLAYNTAFDRAGNEVVSADQINEGEEFSDGDVLTDGFDRFCSSVYVPANEFGEGRGIVDGIYFTGEETGGDFGGTEYALDVESGEIYALPYLGRAAWENVTQLDTGENQHVAILIGDDRAGVPLTLYVGVKDTSEGADFLSRNGLNNGKLYAWVSDDGTTNPTGGFVGTGSSRSGRFVEIPIFNPDQASEDGSTGYDSLGFATIAKQDELYAELGAFLFSRPEDVATNPDDGDEAVLASTGNRIFGDADLWGTTYRIDVDFQDIEGGDISAEIDILYDGDAAEAFDGVPDAGLRSPDNLDWADDGLIYIQEDRSIGGFGDVSGEETSIWSLDPDAEDTGASLERVAQIDRSAVPEGQMDIDPDDLGDWETSGILDVSELFDKAPGELLIFDVQAHSLRGGAIGLPDIDDSDPLSDDSNLVQGGQLAFLINEAAGQSQLVFGSAGNDEFVDGVNDLLFTGAGEDLIDLSVANAGSRIYSGSDDDEIFAGEDDRVFGGPGEDVLDASVGEGGNRLYGGEGNDELYAGENDRLFGGDGDDILDASVGKGDNRLYGGDGDDLFSLGQGDHLVGGGGRDIFFVGTGGNNTISGGEGADAFWVATAGSLPDESNVITDFDPVEDVIGAGGFSAGDLSFGEEDGKAILSIGGEAVATFLGVSQGDLESATFAF